MAGKTNHGVLDKDSTVWQDGAIPANTCIPPSTLGNELAQLCSISTPKIHLQVLQNSKIYGDIFCMKKITFGDMSLSNLNSYILQPIEMKGITRCKLTIISESAVCKKFLGQIWSYPTDL
jgi:hypothetical protein